MMCLNCKEYKLLLWFEEYIVSLNPTECEYIENIFKTYAKIADKDFECMECGSQVVKGESYIEDNEKVSKVIFRYMAEQIMKDIECCEECGDGENIQGLFPSIKSCFNDEDDDPEAIFDSFNTSSTIDDIMNEVFESRLNIWEPYYKNIVEYVKCPNCDNGSGVNYDEKRDYGKFDLYTEVYTKHDIDRFDHYFYGDELEKIKVEISDLAKNFSFDELLALKNDYIQNRMNSMCNPLFDKLEQFIKSLFAQKNWYALSENRVAFRTRISPIGKKLSKEQLWEPPYGIASHSRYNDSGMSMLYCANNKEVIKKEITLPCGHNYNIAKIIIHKPMCLFPINNIFGGEFAGLIDEAVPTEQQNINFKQQYIISNIVSAICFQVGYDGIVYCSTKDNISIDYALFCKYEKGKDLEIISIEV